MKDGRRVEQAPAAAILDAPREPYTRALMAADFNPETDSEAVAVY